MKSILTVLLSIFILFSCTDKKEEESSITSSEPILEVDNAFMDISDSTDKLDNLVHYQYQNKTVWGGIEVWYMDTDIIKIRANQRGEMGFLETTHFYEEGSNYKSIEIKHLANWKEFEDKYGEIDAVDDDRMTYTDDTTETVAHHSVLDSFDLKMIQEASELMIFVSNENKLVP